MTEKYMCHCYIPSVNSQVSCFPIAMVAVNITFIFRWGKIAKGGRKKVTETVWKLLSVDTYY